MKNTNNKGFTLIEMLVVVAVVAILSGLTLTGIGGFTSRARDTRRIGDLRNIQTVVETYYSKCGFYPGDGSCNTTAYTGSWPGFEAILSTAVGANISRDPVASKTYFYGVNSDRLRYVLGAVLENDNSALDDAADLDDDDVGLGGMDIISWTTGGSTTACEDDTFGYCIGN